MKRLSRQIVPYFIVIWVAFLALSGIAPCCDLRGAGVPHSHAGEAEYEIADHNSEGATPQHHGDATASQDRDSAHSHCPQLSNAEYDLAKTGVLTDVIRVPTPVFLLATVDAGLIPHQAVDVLVARSTFHPPPLKQPLYLLIKHFLI